MSASLVPSKNGTKARYMVNTECKTSAYLIFLSEKIPIYDSYSNENYT